MNGREVTSEDVKYSLERFINEKGNANRNMLASVDRVEAPDKYTVRVMLKEPFAWFLDMLVEPDGGLHRGQGVRGEVRRSEEGEAVVGTGPWMLDSYRPNVGLTFVRNPTYFQPGLPYIDRVEVTVDEDNASRMAAFLARQVRHRLGVPRRHQPRSTGCRSRT